MKLFRKFKYDIAISVAEEDLEIASTIVNSLKAKRISYYFYTEQSVENWGQHILRISLAKYGAEARYVLVIISKHFVEKYWASIENQVVQVFRPGKDIYILPLRVDDTPVDGISKYIAFIKWEKNQEEIADKIKKKISLRKRMEKRRVGRFISIIAVLLIAVYFLLPLTSTSADYSKYLDYLNRGDSLMKENKFQMAEAEYKRALKYNPKDIVAARKLSLLDSANNLIKQQNHASASKLFEVIINLPASNGLTATALENANVKSNPPFSVSISWDGNSLKINISGGIPFNSESQPYIIDGLQCTDCIEWKKDKNNYVANIKGSNVRVDHIRLKDRLGQFSNQMIPENTFNENVTVSNPDKPVEKTNATAKSSASKEEEFISYIKTGDSLFNKQKYADAKKEYSLALNIKPRDEVTIKKIADCDEKRLAADEVSEKNIPRISVPNGLFIMGSNDGNPDDGPEHNVNIKSFIMSKTEVTVGQYKLYCQYTGRQMPPSTDEWSDDHPITNVTWAEAAAYCAWVKGRLPTEAEWEYAAKAGANSIYSGGNQVNSFAWHAGNSGNKAQRVAKKSPNAFGLYDMTGNVWEWCSDWYGRKYYSLSEAGDPQGPASGSERVIRGGAFNSFVNSAQDGNQLRISYRNSENSSARKPFIGFRVVWN